MDIKNNLTSRSSPLEQAEELYNRNRFLDAYTLCRGYFEGVDRIRSESIREILLLGRLAKRLGSRKLVNRLFGMAREKAPEDPLVIYFAGRTENSHENLLLHLEEIESFPKDKFEREEDEASWLASSGWVYALVRDFEKAHSFITAAKELQTENAWVKCCEAEILCMEDRWPEALKVVEAAWQLSAGMPQAAATLGRIKAKLGHISGAASTILDAAGEEQSFETLLAGLWCLCAHAERSAKPEREELAKRAWELSKQLAPLAPLADKDLLSNLATTRIDIAWLMNDRERMRSQAKDVQHPFYQSVLKNIEANGPGAVRTTAYKPIFQKHNTCLPTSVAAVCHHFKIEVDEDALAAELTYRGTAIWRVVDWLKERGLATRPFVATSEIARILMNQGIPFVLFQKTVSFYHALAAVGIDEEADVLIVHDPGYTRMAQFLLKEIGKGEAPFGPEALAVVPEKEAQHLDLIPDVSSAPFTAFLEYCKALDSACPGSGRSIIKALKERFPENPFSGRMEAIYLGLMGKAGIAIEHQKTLLKQFPDCEHIRQELLSSLYQTGNSALIRKILSEIVLQKKIPGTRSTQEWKYPPAEYISQYANYLGMDHAGHGEAVEMLLDALKREPAHAPSYHVLGDIHRQQDAFTECLLPYRCAATLEMENDHYARSFLDAMAKVRRIEEGFEFLKGRVKKLGGAISGERCGRL